MFSYYVLYKPYETLSQFSASGEKKTLKDVLKVPPDVYPVGRLDYDSEGMLLLTNDPRLNAVLLHPSHAHARTYYVQVEGVPDTAALEKLRKGVEIQVNGKKHRTLPAKAELLEKEPALPERTPPIRFRKNIPTAWISLTLTEGRNRQVRRMTAAVGFPTLRLVRYAMGSFTMEGWAAGEYRSYPVEELRQKLFRKQ